MGKNRRQDKTETLRERLQEEQTRLLFEIDKAASTIEGMSAGKIYSAYGAKAVQRQKKSYRKRSCISVGQSSRSGNSVRQIKTAYTKISLSYYRHSGRVSPAPSEGYT